MDCDGEVSQWTTDDLKQYCILKDAARISCLDVTLLYRVITCNVPGSYGYSNDILPAAIWVRNDCYAQFKVCYTTGKHGHFVRYINDSKGDRFIASSFLETHTNVVWGIQSIVNLSWTYLLCEKKIYRLADDMFAIFRFSILKCLYNCIIYWF